MPRPRAPPKMSPAEQARYSAEMARAKAVDDAYEPIVGTYTDFFHGGLGKRGAGPSAATAPGEHTKELHGGVVGGRQRGFAFTEQELTELLASMDPNGDGELDLAEVGTALRRAHKDPEKAGAMMARLDEIVNSRQLRTVDLYRELDDDHSGTISLEELRDGLMRFARPTGEERAMAKRAEEQAAAKAAADQARAAKEHELAGRLAAAKDSGAYDVLIKLEGHMRKRGMRVKDIFSKSGFDKSGDGVLDRAEFGSAIASSAIGIRMSTDEVDLLVQFLDNSGDGEIQTAELEHAIQRLDKDVLTDLEMHHGKSTVPTEKAAGAAAAAAAAKASAKAKAKGRGGATGSAGGAKGAKAGGAPAKVMSFGDANSYRNEVQYEQNHVRGSGAVLWIDTHEHDTDGHYYRVEPSGTVEGVGDGAKGNDTREREGGGKKQPPPLVDSLLFKDVAPEFVTTGGGGAFDKRAGSPRRPAHGRDHHRDHSGATLKTHSPRPLHARLPRTTVPASQSWAEEHGLVEFQTGRSRGRRVGLHELSMAEASVEVVRKKEETMGEMERHKREIEEWARCQRAQHPYHYYRPPPVDPTMPAAPDRPTRAGVAVVHPNTRPSAKPFRGGDSISNGFRVSNQDQTSMECTEEYLRKGREAAAEQRAREARDARPTTPPGYDGKRRVGDDSGASVASRDDPNIKVLESGYTLHLTRNAAETHNDHEPLGRRAQGVVKHEDKFRCGWIRGNRTATGEQVAPVRVDDLIKDQFTYNVHFSRVEREKAGARDAADQADYDRELSEWRQGIRASKPSPVKSTSAHRGKLDHDHSYMHATTVYRKGAGGMGPHKGGSQEVSSWMVPAVLAPKRLEESVANSDPAEDEEEGEGGGGAGGGADASATKTVAPYHVVHAADAHLPSTGAGRPLSPGWNVSPRSPRLEEISGGARTTWAVAGPAGSEAVHSPRSTSPRLALLTSPRSAAMSPRSVSPRSPRSPRLSSATTAGAESTAMTTLVASATMPASTVTWRPHRPAGPPPSHGPSVAVEAKMAAYRAKQEASSRVKHESGWKGSRHGGRRMDLHEISALESKTAHRMTSHRDHVFEEKKRAAHSGVRSSGEATELAYTHMGPTHRERAVAKKLAIRPVGGGARVVIPAHAHAGNHGVSSHAATHTIPAHAAIPAYSQTLRQFGGRGPKHHPDGMAPPKTSRTAVTRGTRVIAAHA